MIAIVDYGMGNGGSIQNMIRRIGGDAVLTSDPAVVAAAEKLILPGVGAFDKAMEHLETLGLLPVLHESVRVRGVPILGICLGMQLFSEGSDEGHRPGLGWIEGRTRRFAFPGPTPPRLPHMGWNNITLTQRHPLFEGLEDDARFYFVHTYHVTCESAEDVVASSNYGIPFTSAVARGNVMGTQFHPEKSHRFGLALMRRFVEAV